MLLAIVRHDYLPAEMSAASSSVRSSATRWKSLWYRSLVLRLF